MNDIKEISILKDSAWNYWDIWVSDSVEARRLERKGWVVDWANSTGPYVHCQIPKNAIAIRTKKAVERLKERSDAMRGRQPASLRKKPRSRPQNSDRISTHANQPLSEVGAK